MYGSIILRRFNSSHRYDRSRYKHTHENFKRNIQINKIKRNGQVNDSLVILLDLTSLTKSDIYPLASNKNFKKTCSKNYLSFLFIHFQHFRKGSFSPKLVIPSIASLCLSQFYLQLLG
jgi:hypothetical protein